MTTIVHYNRPSIVAAIAAAIFLGDTATCLSNEAPKPVQKITWQKAKMDSSLAERVDTLVAKSIEDGQMSGCVVLIGRRGGIVFEKAYGNRRVEPEKEDMTIDTLFDMIERGKLRL
jgi:CubicO group peptidase (beta-lactamase class C family)